VTAGVRQIVIVGSGDCGTRTALTLRELGFDGDLVLVGDEHEEPYERPVLSKGLRAGNDGELRHITTSESLADAGIEWISGTRAVRIDADFRTTILNGGREIRYDRLLLCTGSRARQLPVPGHEETCTVRSATDAAHVRSSLIAGGRVVIIGGGFIGLEVAASAVGWGCEVTVIEFAHELMARVVPIPVAHVLRDRHLAEGVDIRPGVSCVSVERASDTLVARLDNGSAVEADLVVVGVGAIPNTELAATAGLPISNGITVDEHLRTGDAAIYAAGDCCSVPHPLYGGSRIRLEAWNNALAQAKVAAVNLLDGSAVYDAVPSFWSDQYDLTMHVRGLHGAATGLVARRRRDGNEIHFGLDDRGRVVCASGVATGNALARDMQLADRLIAQQTTPRASALSDPDIDLRSLLR